MNRLSKSQAPEESAEMKDSRLYAESCRKPVSQTVTEPANEDAGDVRVHQRERKNPAYATPGSAS